MTLTTSSSPNVLLVKATFNTSLKLFISWYTAHLRLPCVAPWYLWQPSSHVCIATQFKLGKHALRTDHRPPVMGDGFGCLG
jgi:hypothetical protein